MEKKLDKKTLNKIYWTWMHCNGSSQQGETMQGNCYAQTMGPAIEKLYGDDKEEVKAALKRHLVLYNVEQQLGAMVPGISAAMEEQRANGADIDADAINTVKVALMGPLSGIGDALIYGTLIPIFLALCISITESAGIIGPLAYLILYPLITVIYSKFLFKKGYETGLEGISKIMASGTIDVLTKSLNLLGLLVMGALGASYVSLVTPLSFTSGEMTVSVQSMLDSVMPNILPLGAIFFVYWMLAKKKKSPIFVMAIIFIVMAAAVALGIF